jgi:multiple sugar transport system substrate-binding protein
MAAKFNRRHFLKAVSTTAAAGVLAACAPTQQAPQTEVPTAGSQLTPTPAPVEPVTLVILSQNAAAIGTEENLAAWKSKNPNIELELINLELTRLAAMWAAGEPPDIWSASAPILPGYKVRKMVQSLQPFVDASSKIKNDDIASAHNLVRYDGLRAGSGELYALAVDWSTEFSLFLQKDTFADAGLDLPPDDRPITWAEVTDMARALVKKTGDRTDRFGLDSQGTTWGFIHGLTEMVDQAGGTLYDEAFSRINLADNEPAKEIIKFWLDLMEEGVVPSTLNPLPSGPALELGALGIQQFGYWFRGAIGPNEGLDKGNKILYITQPLWSSNTTRRNPPAAITCHVMSSQTQHADAAWKFFEWYNTEEPAIAGAKAGWGLPALMSLWPLMPNATPFDQQVQRVLAEDLKTIDQFTLQFNPFYDSQNVSTNAFNEQSQQYLTGDITFDELLLNMQSSINGAIQDGIDRVS